MWNYEGVRPHTGKHWGTADDNAEGLHWDFPEAEFIASRQWVLLNNPFTMGKLQLGRANEGGGKEESNH